MQICILATPDNSGLTLGCEHKGQIRREFSLKYDTTVWFYIAKLFVLSLFKGYI